MEPLGSEGEGAAMLLCHAVTFINVIILVHIHTGDYTGNIPSQTHTKYFNLRAALPAPHSQPGVLSW